jgi:hypothetical protein
MVVSQTALAIFKHGIAGHYSSDSSACSVIRTYRPLILGTEKLLGNAAECLPELRAN